MKHSESYKKILARLGYYDYQSGLIFRRLDQQTGWDEHLEKCRNYILKAIDKYKPSKVTVLGSGWLLELPIAEMLEKIDNITLIDIIHPPEVIKQAGAFDKVKFIEYDLSGGLIEEVWRWRKSKPFFRKPLNLEGLNIPDYESADNPGLLISLNLLTQLETLPVRFLEKTTKIDKREIYNFRKTIQEKHIAYISRYTSVLITDYEEVITDMSGNLSGEPTLIADVPECVDREEWIWDFDLKGSDYYNKRSVMKVLACTIEGNGKRKST